METILKLSEAVSLALHASVLLASNHDGNLSNRQMAVKLNVSEAHLSKVLQRLVKVGLVQSMRGPKGGFVLGKASEKISLLNIYEAIEGPFHSSHCLFGTKMCKSNKCIFGDLLGNVDKQVYEYLSVTRLSDTTGINFGDKRETFRTRNT